MDSQSLRNSFLSFFSKNNHKIVSSAPIVVKNDPTLMFTNAGMNQFKDIFLGNSEPEFPMVANSQKCLRVSGKHNDLEEVGHDTYHHTMFEMLGNWSFGDYFKEKAIQLAYEFLVKELGIPSERLYATVFEGSGKENLSPDLEAMRYWKNHLPDNQILMGSKEDNFWEMGETGPCGPCSEIHIDIRSASERDAEDGAELVNKDHPLVIEIWNLVFIQYHRKSDGNLEKLPKQHIDTGMGFERLCMIMQNKQSSYDTDLFLPIIEEISNLSGVKYGNNNQEDTAMRVIADHLRTLAFSIADGQIPSNNKAGYVIRRILRRAVRYGFSFLGQTEPFIFRLIPTLISKMATAYPELKAQQQLIERVIEEEERAFLRTLETGIKRLDQITRSAKSKIIDGKSTFDLYDTFGFPPDLTELILKEKGFSIDHREFEREMQKQKTRSRQDAKIDAGDWTVISNSTEEFVGYDFDETDTSVTRYRKVKSKGKTIFHLALSNTPFYAESGGQIGDTGTLEGGGEKIRIINTIKENDLNIHIAENLPSDIKGRFKATVNVEKRIQTANNHTATHLLHDALRSLLGRHVEQKGSLVHFDYLRFDFSHFQKLSDEEISSLESYVNNIIRSNIPRDEKRAVSLEKARTEGAISLFGEKYDNVVRTIRFGKSIELCGGIHSKRTGDIGLFKITSESAIAAGIRRIEALTGAAAENWVNLQLNRLKEVSTLIKSNTASPVKALQQLLKDKQRAEKKLDQLTRDKIKNIKSKLVEKIEKVGQARIISEITEADSPATLKDISFQLKGEIPGLVLIIGAEIDGKAHLSIMIAEELISGKNLNANEIIRDVSRNIRGGGGGQPFFATAGGKEPAGLGKAISEAAEKVRNSL